MTDPDSAEIARKNLLRAINQLPYSGALLSYTPLLNSDDEETIFLSHITAWLNRFADVLHNISETNTNLVNELHELRTQKTAIRDFLGLNTTEKGTTE